MKEYIVISYNNSNIKLLNNNLTRTILYTIILKKLLKIQKILDSVNLLSNESIRNLKMYIEVDIANKEREIIDCIIKKEIYNKLLEKMMIKEKKVLGLFDNIIKFLEKAIDKRKNIDNNFTIENTVCRENLNIIKNIDDDILKKIESILNKLKLLTDLLKDNKSANITTMIKKINKMEENIYDEYESITVTINDNDELSLSI
jgi:hypothetical protein